ncbi:Acyl-CoA-binding domain-containing protein 3 [Morella rubra]|uniref:Acyl-CoA-binding domain-containing protein 3 n=1 Tax=Morella rubra TaxID=262757 RepID=A0A6A1UU70_9ROSI|nr:Acyl-CoA-binding domain-containing protein 3 [Morella rubra]
MELFQELFLTASLALLLSFLVAKLVSMALAGDAWHHESRLKSGRNVGEELTMEELRFGERLTVPGYESERKVHEVIEEAAPGKVDEFKGESIQAEEIVKITHRAELGEELLEGGLKGEPKDKNLQEIVGLAEKLSGEIIEESGTVEKSLESRVDGESSAEKEVVPESEGDSLAVEKRLESIPDGESSTEKEVVPESEEHSVNVEKGVERRMEVESAPEKEVVPESEEIGRVVEREVREKVEEKEVSFDSEEDDWEGIERSELEKAFVAAAKFVLESASGGKEDLLATAGVGSDVQMDLYGLHKIATEGPCRDPQPMALKLSARAKWNAWQRLGQMSPELAMEQYIKLLSDRVPGWIEGKFASDVDEEAGISNTFASDLTTFSHHQPNNIDEREPEHKTEAEGGDWTGGSNFEERAKE